MQKEAQLRASESRFRRLFETAKDGILILDFSTGQITDANPFIPNCWATRATSCVGHPSREAIGLALNRHWFVVQLFKIQAHTWWRNLMLAMYDRLQEA